MALLSASLLAYGPALHGGLLWDDDAHVTRPELRSWHGLWRIWFELNATQQYYPLLHTAFWIQSQLWGDSVLGYHMVNVVLHFAAAVLAASILRRLAVAATSQALDGAAKILFVFSVALVASSLRLASE